MISISNEIIQPWNDIRMNHRERFYCNQLRRNYCTKEIPEIEKKEKKRNWNC